MFLRDFAHLIILGSHCHDAHFAFKTLFFIERFIIDNAGKFLGSIADFHIACEKKQKIFTVLASKGVMRQFEQTGFTKFLKIQLI